jgi:hypothetical protein
MKRGFATTDENKADLMESTTWHLIFITVASNSANATSLPQAATDNEAQSEL